MFNNLAEGHFFPAPDGNTYYIPWAFFGKTYRIDTDAQKKRIKKWMTLTVIGLFIFFIAFVYCLQIWDNISPWLLLLIFPIYGIFWHILNKSLTKPLILSEYKPKLSDAFRYSVGMIAAKILIFLFILNVLALLLGVYAINRPNELAIGIFLIGSSLIGIIYLIFILHVKYFQKETDSE